MDNFTTNNYEMKRDIINFSKKISEDTSKPESKFVMDMIYGISKSKDILLSSIAGALDEKTKNKLEFVSALAANPKASPQTVSFLNQELKKISASYKKEIDAYEQMGLAKRKIKEEK